MERITLGRTGLSVNRYGFGGIPIQRVDEDQAVETVRHAVEQGVDFIDTSRAYTTSEGRIGKALKLTDKKVILASKSVSRKAEDVRADLEKSLSELQVDHIDLYQCHFVSTQEDYQRVIQSAGALDALVKAKDEGLISHIGITSHNLEVLDQALNDGLFDTIMVCFSFLEPAAKESIIPKALDKKYRRHRNEILFRRCHRQSCSGAKVGPFPNRRGHYTRCGRHCAVQPKLVRVFVREFCAHDCGDK